MVFMKSVDRAVEILNGYSHRDYGQWFRLNGIISCNSDDEYLTEFEALAVAEQYMRGKPMTIDGAIEILNQNFHRNPNGEKNPEFWYINGADLVRGQDQYDFLEPFEAIAIAEKYQRDQA